MDNSLLNQVRLVRIPYHTFRSHQYTRIFPENGQPRFTRTPKHIYSMLPQRYPYLLEDKKGIRTTRLQGTLTPSGC